jgi:hypothetical protein
MPPLQDAPCGTPSQAAGRLVAINWSVRCCSNNVVGLSGLEPLTSRLSGVCSNQLSYKPPRVLLRFRRYALVKDSHRSHECGRWRLAGLRQQSRWQRNSSGEEKGYHILYGSWRLNEDWKPVIDLCFAALNGQQLLTTSSYP